MTIHVGNIKAAEREMAVPTSDKLASLLVDLRLIFRFLHHSAPTDSRLHDEMQTAILEQPMPPEKPLASFVQSAVERSVGTLAEDNNRSLFGELTRYNPQILSGILAYARAVKKRKLLSPEEAKPADAMIAIAEKRRVVALPFKPAIITFGPARRTERLRNVGYLHG